MDSDFTHQIFGIGWKRNNPEAIAYPHIQIRDLSNNKIVDPPLQDFDFNWILSEQRFCTGYHDEYGEYHRCPFSNESNNSFGQCISCSKKVGFEHAFFFGGEINSRMQEHLAKPHLVYLAFFQPNIIKVGTAVESRNTLRTLEQDALMAVFIAESDGFTIQSIERAISKLGFTEAVKSSIKFRYISSKPNLESASEQLYSAWQKVYAALQNTTEAQYLYDFANEQDFRSQVHNHLNNPHLLFPGPEQHLRIDREQQTLAGGYAGLRGKYLILKQPQGLIAYSKSQLTGKLFKHSNQPLAHKAPEQPSLFGV